MYKGTLFFYCLSALAPADAPGESSSFEHLYS